jgi:hypothetical protein
MLGDPASELCGLRLECDGRVRYGAWLGRAEVAVVSANGKCINNETANAHHKQQRHEKYAVGNSLDTVHPA